MKTRAHKMPLLFFLLGKRGWTFVCRYHRDVISRTWAITNCSFRILYRFFVSTFPINVNQCKCTNFKFASFRSLCASLSRARLFVVSILLSWWISYRAPRSQLEIFRMYMKWRNAYLSQLSCDLRWHVWYLMYIKYFMMRVASGEHSTYPWITHEQVYFNVLVSTIERKRELETKIGNFLLANA